MRQTARRLGLSVLLLFVLPLNAIAQQSLVWREDVLFERISIDENVQDILRAVLTQNGVDTIFKRGVEGTVTFQFKDMPLQAVFNKLIQENDLDFDYDPNLNVMTVFPKKEVVARLELFSPKNVELDEIEQALSRFDVHGGRVIYDYESATLVVRGAGDEVEEILKVARHIDDSFLKRLEAGDRKASLERQRRLKQLEAKALEKALVDAQIQTAVIPLRYVSVTSSETFFQGKRVTLPGIDQTLRVLLGIKADGQLSADQAIGSDEGAASLQTLRNLQASEAKASGESLGSQFRQVISFARVKAQISTDARTNSVIVRGPVYVIEDVKRVLRELDRPAPMVDIEVMVVQANAGVSRQLGVEWASATRTNAAGKNIAGFATGANAASVVTDTAPNLDAATTDPITLLPIANPSGIAASFIYNGSRSFITAAISALASDNKAELISTPHVVTLNNVPAKIASTTSVQLSTNAGANSAGELVEVDAGISLDITASVFSDDLEGADALIRLFVDAELSGFTGNDNTERTEREMQTQVVLRNGATFVMGGLFENTRTETESGVPGLRDLPIIGGLFESQTADAQRRETIFFISPRVVEQKELLSADIGIGRDIRQQRSVYGKSLRKYVKEESNRLINREAEELHKRSNLDTLITLEEDE